MTNRLVKILLTPANKAATGIAASQTPGGAGNLTLNGTLVSGGVAVLNPPQRVAIAGTGAETGKTFTITGTDRNGRVISESIAGPSNNTVYTAQDFATVTQIAVSAGTAAAITVGTSDMISSQWVVTDRKKAASLGFGVKVTGTINYTVEHTYDDPFTPGVGVLPPGGMPGFAMTPYPHGTVASKTGNADGAYVNQPITAVRVTINSYSNGATAELSLAPGVMEDAS